MDLDEQRILALEARVSLLEQTTKATGAKQRLAAAKNEKASKPTIDDITPADDDDLDGQYGDPLVKYDPFGWQGPSGVGLTYSQQTAEYLRAAALSLADRAQFLNTRGNDGDERRSRFASMDASRALGWALRVEAGGGRPAPGQGEPDPTEAFGDMEPPTPELPF